MASGSGVRKKAPGGTKIRAPKVHKPSESSDETWLKLRESFSEILNNRSSSLSFEEVYRQSYNLVLHRKGAVLYEGVRDLVSRHLDAQTHARIEPAFPSSTGGATDASAEGASGAERSTQAQAGERFLAAVKGVWDEHIACLSKLRDVLKYMDKVYIQQTSPPSLPTYSLGLSLFLSTVLRNDSLPVQEQLLTVVLAQIRLDREGEAVNKSAVRACVEMLSLLRHRGGEDGETVYRAVFEDRFLAESRTFYAAESERLLSSVSAPEYLTKVRHAFRRSGLIVQVDRRLQEEQARVQHYLQPSTDIRLSSLLDDVLIQQHLDRVLSHSSGGLDTLITEDRLDDLRRLYTLFGRVGAGHQRLRKGIRDWLLRRGTFLCDSAAVPGAAGGDDDEPPADTKGKGRPNATAASGSSALTWVQSVLDLKAKMDAQLNGPFEADKQFEATINDSFSDFMNQFARSPEFLSLFLDENLKKGLKGKSEAEVDAVLNQTISIFRHLSDKDVFEKYYKGHLARRLIHNRSVSDDAERSVLAKLQLESGVAFTRDLEGMMRDVKTSSDTASDYKNRMARAGSRGFELSALVCTSSHWPMPHINSPCKLPTVLGDAIRSFQHFYDTKHTGRKLTWRPDMGNVDIKIRFAARTHEVNVSTYGAVVLLLFENVSVGDSLGLADIATATGIPSADLGRTLQSLACAKFKVLLKEPKGREINENDRFTFNHAFTTPLARFKIQTIIAKVETAEEVSETQEKIESERRLLTEAAVVRVMKSSTERPLADLVQEVTRLLAVRFKPKPMVIKQSVERLIEREYLKRSEANRTRIVYLA